MSDLNDVTEIAELRALVEKLTKERDFWREGCQKEKLSAIEWAGKHQAQMLDHKQLLADLAVQNEKMRKILVEANQPLSSNKEPQK